ncbi:RFX2 protein [Oopsacas minuta]|uniref:RFX2 protein n=1 Tax=Oopsacas minuta TaxID=111878 RepID=A0AAV7JBU3_9METZ|nr:RFX2 protein [Oopsacas minuta]
MLTLISTWITKLLTEYYSKPNRIGGENLGIPNEITVDVTKVEEINQRHCEALFELICTLNFNSVKSVWFNFWRGPEIDGSRDNLFCPTVLQPPFIVETISSMKKLYRSASIFLNQESETDHAIHEDSIPNSEDQKQKSSEPENAHIQSINNLLSNIDPNTSLNQSNLYKDNILHRLCSSDTILAWSRKCDQILYQSIISALIPDVLRPIPTSITQELRQFAKSLDILLLESIYDYPIKFLNSKLATILSFSQILRRYTSLNHLAHAARTVLQNPRNTLEMYNDIQKVNFFSIHEQASWICQCDVSLISRLEQEFKSTLVKQPTLDNWGTWLENVVSNCLQSANSSEDLIEYSRQFLLKWSFYSSMIIRDLTLRSSSSFGSFHLIRLLFDEYTFYLIEQKIARGTNRLPIDVTSEFACFSPKEFNSAMNIPSHSFTVYSLQDKFHKPIPNEQLQSHLNSNSLCKDVLK